MVLLSLAREVLRRNAQAAAVRFPVTQSESMMRPGCPVASSR